MLLSAVVALTAERDAALPPALGRGVHALLLGLVRRHDPRLAEELHSDQPVKPFTVSFLEEGVLSGEPATRCRAGQRCHLRFTSLDDRVSALLAERVLVDLPERVHLDGVPFKVTEVATSSSQHPWAGRASYEELARQYLMATTPAARIGLAFHSPTTFRSQGRHVPLPLPSLVFGSLLDRWNSFAPIRLEDARGYLADGVAVSRYRLETRLVEVGGGKQVGFVGQCHYTAVEREPYAVRVMGLLAEYAFYSGVGHKTTMGLGRARRVVSPGRGRSDGCVVPG